MDLEWGKGSLNNTIDWGKAPTLDFKTGNFGHICRGSYAGETNITGFASKPPKEEPKKGKK